MSGIEIKALTHDLSAKKSFVTLVWENDSTQSLVLPVPFGCALDALPLEAEKAVRDLAREISTIPVRTIA